jgi:hypothetical protein
MSISAELTVTLVKERECDGEIKSSSSKPNHLIIIPPKKNLKTLYQM